MPEHPIVQQLYEELCAAWTALQTAGPSDVRAKEEFDRKQDALYRTEVGDGNARGTVWRIIRSWAGRVDDMAIEDVVQDAWLVLISQGKLFQTPPASYRAVLLTAIKRKLIDRWRSRANQEGSLEMLESAHKDRTVPRDPEMARGVSVSPEAPAASPGFDAPERLPAAMPDWERWKSLVIVVEDECLTALRSQPARPGAPTTINQSRALIYQQRRSAFARGVERGGSNPRKTDERHAKAAVSFLRHCMRERLTRIINDRRLMPPDWPTSSQWNSLLEAMLARAGDFAWSEEERRGWNVGIGAVPGPVAAPRTSTPSRGTHEEEG